MRPSILLSVLLLLFLGGILYYIIDAEGGPDEIPRLLQRAGINLPQNTVTPPPASNNHQFVSGSSRFSQGACTTDSDCVPTGCSGEVCSNTPDAVSTCEFSEDFPNVRGFACGCYQGYCGWSEEE